MNAFRRVNNIRPKYEIELSRYETLQLKRFLYVENCKPHKSMTFTELSFAMTFKRRLDICVNIFNLIFKFAYRLYYEARCRPCSGTHFQDSNGLASSRF